MKTPPLAAAAPAALAALAALALLAALPTASAQDPGVRLDLTAAEPAKPVLAPAVDVVAVAVGWKVVCTSPASDPTPLLFPSRVLQFEPPEAPAGLVVAGSLAVTVEMPDCLAQMERTGTATFHVSATREAPGEQQMALRFQATLLRAHERLQDVPAEPVEAIVQVAYMGLLSAQAATTIQQGEPGKVLEYPVTVTNLGNARTQVAFAAPKDQRLEGQMILPEDLVLEAGESATATVRYSSARPVDEPFTFWMTPLSTRQAGLAGNTVQVNMLAHVAAPRPEPSPAAAAPGAPAALAAVALLAVAAAGRRLRA